MKKFLPLLLILVSSIFIFSCKDDDDVQVNVDYPAVYDKTVSFSYNQDDGWNYFQTFTRPMLSQDIVLIYLQTDTTTSGSPVWTPLPAKFNPILNGVGQEVYYDFDFTANDFKIYVRGTFDLSQQASLYLNNKTFRIVLVPAEFGRNANSVDPRTLSYDEVIAKYHIDDSKIGKL